MAKQYYFSLAASAIFFLAGVLTLSSYGINWDAPDRMLRGQAEVDFLVNPFSVGGYSSNLSPIIIKDNEFISRFDFLVSEGLHPADLPDNPKFQSDINTKTSFYNSQYWNKQYRGYQPGGHPSFPDILAAFSNRIFYQGLGIVGDIQSYQLFYLLFSAVGVFIVSIFAFELTKSYFAAAIAALSLGLSPLFFAESHINMKDPLLASFFAGAIWSFWHWIREWSRKWFITFSTFTVVSVLIKWNIIFLPVILAPTLFLIRKPKLWWAYFLSIPLVALVFLILTEPFSWKDPVGHIFGLIKYYYETGTRADPIQPAGFTFLGSNLYPPLLLLLQTPEVILILAGLGIFSLFYFRRGLPTSLLLVFWLFIPIFRISMPGVWFYNGIRQIMEVFPALAVLSGLGANYITEKSKVKSQNLSFVLLIATFLLLLIPLIKYHPNQNLYFNNLVGGIKGATEKNLVEKKLSYGNIYKQAADWINQNSKLNSKIAFLDGPMFALSPLFLREEISLSPDHFSGFDQKGEYIISLLDNSPAEVVTFANVYAKTFLVPVHEVKVQNVTVASVYQNDPSNLLSSLGNEEEVTDFKYRIVPNPKGAYLEIILSKEARVNKIILNKLSGDCTDSFARYVDELVSFDSGEVFGLQERKKTKDGKLEFWFPAVKTKVIKIIPQSQYSCFKAGKIDSIVVLP